MTASSSTTATLLADIGGTNARFALLADGKLSPIAHMAVGDFGTFQQALAAYLDATGQAGPIRHAVFAASGPIQNGRCALTNNSWIIDAAELCSDDGFSSVRLINDLEAVAWALPRLPPSSLLQLGGRERVAGALLAAGGPSRAAVDMFSAMLGSVAGNLALAVSAKGGIFIAGGILRHMPKFLAASLFRARLEDKGRLKAYLARIPAYLVLDDDVAFVGLRALREAEGLG